jgi:light-regulated signal transduction histidine kinase (bacteriophytochrome)
MVLKKNHEANNLTKQNKQLEDFAFVVSHNFRAPVSNLHSLIEHLRGRRRSQH